MAGNADPAGGSEAEGAAERYVPIACIEHERLEFAVLRRQRLRLRFLGESGEACSLVVLPIDVVTRDAAEWLSYRSEGGETAEVRLDRILAARPLE